MPVLLQNYKRIFENDDEVFAIYNKGTRVWPVGDLGPEPPDYTEPFYVENITNSTETVTFQKEGSGTTESISLQYSSDADNWTTLGTISTTALTLQLNAGQKIYLRANANYWGSSSSGRQTIKGCSKIGGNIMSLLYGSNFTGNEVAFPSNNNNVFKYVFRENSNLVDASKLVLPCMTMTEYCYAGMFTNCANLEYSPVQLPATNLAYNCYDSMFEYCTSMEIPPQLPATTLVERCYRVMFRYSGLVESPDLNAQTMVTDCYRGMFQGCSNLSRIRCTATTGMDIGATGWTTSVAANGTFYKATGVTWPTGTAGIPTGWTVVEV